MSGREREVFCPIVRCLLNYGLNEVRECRAAGAPFEWSLVALMQIVHVSGKHVDILHQQSKLTDSAADNSAVYLVVGIANSAPLGVLSGQRCMMDFWRV